MNECRNGETSCVAWLEEHDKWIMELVFYKKRKSVFTMLLHISLCISAILYLKTTEKRKKPT